MNIVSEICQIISKIPLKQLKGPQYQKGQIKL